jgi:hypothetical protein
MALESGQQQIIQLSTLYKLSKNNNNNVRKQIAHSYWINSGTVDVYTSDSATQPTALSNMTLNSEDTNVGGKNAFGELASYIAFVQNTGTTTELILNNVNAESLGSIS